MLQSKLDFDYLKCEHVYTILDYIITLYRSRSDPSYILIPVLLVLTLQLCMQYVHVYCVHIQSVPDSFLLAPDSGVAN